MAHTHAETVKMTMDLQQLNIAPVSVLCSELGGIYEHSSWIVAQALADRPFASLAAFQQAMIRVVDGAGDAEQLALIRAHPELAGKAMVAGKLTAESENEQGRAGLAHCTQEEWEKLQQLNAAYKARFGFPFVLAVRGPRGLGLERQAIISAFEQRLQHDPLSECAQALRHIHRIADIRLQDKFSLTPILGNDIWDKAAALSATGNRSATLVQMMQDAGWDSVDADDHRIVGHYAADRQDAVAVTVQVSSIGAAACIPLVLVAAYNNAQTRPPIHLQVVIGQDRPDAIGIGLLPNGVLTQRSMPLGIGIPRNGTVNRRWQHALEDIMRSNGLPLVRWPADVAQVTLLIRADTAGVATSSDLQLAADMLRQVLERVAQEKSVVDKSVL